MKEVSTGSGSDRVDLAGETPVNLSTITHSLSLEFLINVDNADQRLRLCRQMGGRSLTFHA